MKKLTLTVIAIALLITIVKSKTLPEKIIRLLDRNAVIEKTVAGENITVYHHNGKGKYKTVLSTEGNTTTLLRSFEEPN